MIRLLIHYLFLFQRFKLFHFHHIQKLHFTHYPAWQLAYPISQLVWRHYAYNKKTTMNWRLLLHLIDNEHYGYFDDDDTVESLIVCVMVYCLFSWWCPSFIYRSTCGWVKSVFAYQVEMGEWVSVQIYYESGF